MARKAQDNPQLDMTPMIDVVFELIIFFVVTIKQEDIFSKLNANRPSPNPNQTQTETNDTQIKIDIGPGGFLFNQRGVSPGELDCNLKQLSATSKNATVLIRCTMDSRHEFLVKALDMCSKYGMHNLSIFSM